MAVLAVTVVIPVNAAKKTNKKQIQVLNLYQDQKTDIEEAEYLVSYLEDKNIDEESVEKQEKEEWYIDIKTGKITKDSQYKRHFYNDGWTIELKMIKEKYCILLKMKKMREVIEYYMSLIKINFWLQKDWKVQMRGLYIWDL